MTCKRSMAAALAAALSVALLAACGEKPQTASKRKADDKPWELAGSQYNASGFKSGDAGAWEQQLKARAQQQNEYNRTGGPR